MEGGTGIEQQEISDSIKIEASVLPPGADKQIRSHYKALSDSIISKYGPFIPQSTKDNAPKAIDKAISAGEVSDVQELFKAWGGEDNPRPILGQAATLKPQDIVVVPVLSGWDKLSPEQKQSLTDQLGTWAEANGISVEDIYTSARIMGSSGHELVHTMQAQGLPESFFELGAEYYGQEAARKVSGGLEMTDENSERRSDFFRQLVTRYGDNVHKLFFGTLKNPLTRFRILRDVEKSTDRLFPDRKYLHHQKLQAQTST